MSARPSRTTSIPIPTSPSNTRNIESVISIPTSLSPTSPYDNRGLVPSSSNLSLARASPRSSAISPGRSSTRPLFEPRIVRAATSQDYACLPHLSSSGTVNTRRPSTSGLRARSVQRGSLSAQSEAPTTTIPPLAFPRPSYLDYSAFRDALHTEAQSSPFLSNHNQADASVASESSSASYSAISTITSSSDSDEDGTSTPPRDTRAKTSITAPLLPSPTHQPNLKLPTRWSEHDRHHFLSVSPDGRDLTYHGTSNTGDKDAASARTTLHVPPACGIYYYEVEIRGKEQKSHISIGFAGPNVKFSRLPGWEPNSWGYHGDDGCSFAAEKNGTAYSHTYGAGDIIGCGIDFSTRRAFYTKNGQFLGPAFENVGKDIDLYPSVGLQHSGESIRVNLGHEPFRFDIDNHVQQQKTHVWNKILSTPLSTRILTHGSSSTSLKAPVSEEASKMIFNRIILSYLIHHGYVKTVRAFQKQQREAILQRRTAAEVSSVEDKDVEMWSISPVIDTASSSNIEDDIERRTRIVNAVISGDIDTAITNTAKYHPAVLDADAQLMLFKLRCRKFVELILETTEMKKKMKQERGRQKGPEVEGFAASSLSTPVILSTTDGDWLEDDMGMDVDDDAAAAILKPAIHREKSQARGLDGTDSLHLKESGSPSSFQYEAALNIAITYGQSLSNDYKNDARPEVRQLFKQTFGIVAWEDPLEAGGAVTEIVSVDARIKLAHELNQAILQSQGRPAQPALETLYRYTSVCVTQLGLMGEGSAAFADLSRELLE